MYDIKYQSIFKNLNYKYNEDTSVVKRRYTANEILGTENKYFQWTRGSKRVNTLKRVLTRYNTF